MNKLLISLEQREKLLEMAKCTFPEYDVVSIKSSHNFRITTITRGIEFKANQIALPYKGEHLGKAYIADIYIPWFEFCMINLRKGLKIHYDNLYRTSIGITPEVHPVDYLYEQFKNKQ